MENTAVAGVLEAIAASALRMAAVLRGAAVDPATDLAASQAAAGPADCPRAAGPSAMCGDLARWQAELCLTVLSGTVGMEAMFAAVKVYAASGYDEAAQSVAGPITSPKEQTAQEMGIVAEVACAMTVSEPAAGNFLAEAHELTTSLPLTLSALQAGSISWQHARVMVDETANLDRPAAAALESHFLDPDAPNPARGCPAGEMVASRFRHKARTWRERHHPVSIERRHARSVADRRLEYSPARDGMAWLSAYLPADQASAIWNRTTAAARALQGPDEARTLSQIRADIAATLLLTNNTTGMNGGNGAANAPGGSIAGELYGLAGAADMAVEPGPGVPSPRAQVLVTVPVFSLLGLTEEPAMLDGYGPIPPSMARHLVADGAESFRRVLIDPRDGAPLEIGRTSYRVTKAQRQWLRMRDGKCPFPGCGNQSLDNEADHILAWAHGGTTGILNLGGPCPKHHRLRHTSAWTPTAATKNEPPGWIAPSGRRYASEHPDWEPPAWPQQLEDACFDAGIETEQERAEREREDCERTDQQRTGQEIGAAQDGAAPPEDPLNEESNLGSALLQTAGMHSAT